VTGGRWSNGLGAIRATLGRGLGRWRQWRVRRVATGLAPTVARRHRGREAQRLETLSLVPRHAAHIRAAAKRNDLPAEAVAGVIVWDGLENPYRRTFARLGPGHVHPFEVMRKSDARRVEDERRIEPASGALERFGRVRDPVWAIDYIAAIMGWHADVFEGVAGVRIRDDIGVLCTLYQGGRSDKRAAQFVRRREQDPSALPKPGNDMGPWVLANITFVCSLLESSWDAATALSRAGEAPTARPALRRRPPERTVRDRRRDRE
jgi:Protein of unknown function (DUF1402)